MNNVYNFNLFQFLAISVSFSVFIQGLDTIMFPFSPNLDFQGHTELKEYVTEQLQKLTSNQYEVILFDFKVDYWDTRGSMLNKGDFKIL